MPRPSEDVIVISDAEEGEILELDDDEAEHQDAERQEGPEREEGEIPDADGDVFSGPRYDAKRFTLDKPNPTRKPKFENFNHLVLFDKPTIICTNFKHNLYQGLKNGFKHSTDKYRNHMKKKYFQNRYHVTPEAKIRRKYKKIEESSESESEEQIKNCKLTRLAIPRKNNNTSLKSRLSYMMKRKSENLDNSENISSLDKIECNQFHSDSNEAQDHNSSFEKNMDVSDDDLDILRELALKSKHIPKQNKYNQENKSKDETSILHIKETDEELEALRLDALKSAMLKKAFKRKRIKSDEKHKEKKIISESDPLIEKQTEDINSTAFLTISLENNIGNLMYDYNNHYDYVYPQIYHDINKETETHIPHSNNANKENNENKQNIIVENEEEDEDSLRSRLLLELRNKKRIRLDPLPETQKPEVNMKSNDSSLIIRLGGSDTESECEETKNLTLMHEKILSQSDFQRNLEYFLKEVRQTATDKISYDNKQTNNNSMVSNSEIVLANKNQLLSHLAKLEKVKLARKEALKKSVEIRKLDKKSILPRKNSISSQSGSDIIKKDTKRILRPSLLINKRLNSNIVHKAPSHVDNGQRALEQQLLLIRKKMVQQNQLLKSMQINLKVLQKKKDTLVSQIQAANLSLNRTEAAIGIKQQSFHKAFQQLTVLQKHHSILQNRCSKNSSKVDNIPTTFIPNNKINAISQFKNTPLQNITKKVIVPNIESKIIKIDDKKQLLNKSIESSEKNKESVINNENTSSEENVKQSENVIIISDPGDIVNSNPGDIINSDPGDVVNFDPSDLAKSTSLTVPSSRSSEKDLICFTEYETPLTGIKSNQSWIGDPQAILCPFDVSGCCKDTSCNYYHPKVANF